jgi:hypothetical protein
MYESPRRECFLTLQDDKEHFWVMPPEASPIQTKEKSGS